MPRTVRPFGDRARPDPEGNAVPYDTPDTGEVLERHGNGHEQAAWPVVLVNEVGIELQPFDARGFRTITSTAVIGPPELVLPANPRRGALTLWIIQGAVSWRVARTAHDALRDDSSLVLVPGLTFRFSWSAALWAQPRDAVAGGTLHAHSEDWAR